MGVQNNFKLSKYSGETDIEVFVRQFENVAALNHWNAQAAKIHLHGSLEGAALECGRAADVAGTLANLRTRFGINARQAKDRLSRLHKASFQSNHALGTEIQKLVRLAYPDFQPANHTTLAIDIFKMVVNSEQLNMHFMAVPLASMDDAIRSADELTQMGKQKRVMAVHERSDQPEDPIAALNGKLDKLMTCVEKNSNAISDLSQQQKARSDYWKKRRQAQMVDPNGREVQLPRLCYACNQPGHIRGDCPQPTANRSGNETPPQLARQTVSG